MTADTGFFRNKRVLVTGGTGSIGSAIVEALLERKPRVVRLISRDDSKQFELAQRHRNKRELRMLIGDVRSRERMTRALAGVDLVFHAAALKHVPACEFNPFEATETNVRGTQNVVEAAIDAGVDRVLGVSTDKAVDPTNVMGATKLLAERLLAAAELYKGPARTRFASVRFGNVIGTRGSLIPLVLGQVARGGPVTVTDPEMSRYIMPLSDAVSLCLDAMERMEGGEVFILKMPRVAVGDLVEVLVEAYAPIFGYRPADIQIEYIGPRAGEKRHEVLLTEDEARVAAEMNGMYVVRQGQTTRRTKPASGGRADEPVLARQELRALLDAAGWLRPQQLPTLS
ncbi:MAG TPA: SDR family NAD(P)-dependent oxidoreductase [Gemmatimonadales bacterium]|nr:SDR family NAD(P)-dependent oxidoreductase [Gemmatimonadales bacterium]